MADGLDGLGYSKRERTGTYQEFLVPGMFAPFAERLVEHGCVRPGSRVLDVACGTGVVSRAAAILASTGGSVAGVDLGEPTLAIVIPVPLCRLRGGRDLSRQIARAARQSRHCLDGKR